MKADMHRIVDMLKIGIDATLRTADKSERAEALHQLEAYCREEAAKAIREWQAQQAGQGAPQA